MADTSLGFRFRYCLHGNDPIIQELTFKDTEILTKGDIVNVESGEIDLGATGDAGLVGIAHETKSGTDSTTTIKCITDSQAVYGVYDANVRLIGATLDISGTTGAMTVASSSNADLVVVAPSSADEETLVMINHGEHLFN